MIKITADGGALGNGTENARCYGSFKVEYKGKIIKHDERFPLLDCSTNNEAEYMAIIKALEYALDWQHRDPSIKRIHVTICSDSNLIVQQINGNFRVKAENLRRFRDEAASLLETINQERKIAKAMVVWEERREIFGVLKH